MVSFFPFLQIDWIPPFLWSRTKSLTLTGQCISFCPIKLQIVSFPPSTSSTPIEKSLVCNPAPWIGWFLSWSHPFPSPHKIMLLFTTAKQLEKRAWLSAVAKYQRRGHAFELWEPNLLSIVRRRASFDTFDTCISSISSSRETEGDSVEVVGYKYIHVS